jgi:two-component system, chemotaxis family, protein-glutamate methylesterase/glutaminase
LSCVLSALPEGFAAAVLVVQHLPPKHPTQIAEILNRRCACPVKQAEAGELLLPGTVYVAPPDHHLLISPDATVSLTQTERVHFTRPSADSTLVSVAAVYGERVLAVVLTGTGRDGAAGVKAVALAGGTVIAQDEATADFFGMPGAAIETGVVDLVLPLEGIGAAVVRLVQGGGSV